MTKLKTHLIPINWLGNSITGWGNGYVAIPEGHPFFGMGYDEIQSRYEISIHGGLTFGSKIDGKDKRFPADFIGMYVIGFDCAHYADTPETCPKEYVEAELANLLAQCEKPVLNEYGKEEKIKNCAPELLEMVCLLLAHLPYGNEAL